MAALSRIALLHADEIRNHDWSDAPFREDRAGHNRATDTKAGEDVLDPIQTDRVKMNVMWTTAQVLRYMDPNFDVYQFAAACGLKIHTPSGRIDGSIDAGLRYSLDRKICRPGTWEADPE